MITCEFKPSFDRTIKTLPVEKRQEIKSLAKQLIELLSKGQRLPIGMGLTRLRGNYWEIRSTIKERILFHYKKSEVDFVLVGSHDHVKNFLKNIK